MNEASLQRLEYDKIKQVIMEYAVSYLGKKHIESMQPMSQMKIIRQKLDETAEAKSVLQYGASVPIPSLEGIEQSMALLGTGYVFSEQDLTQMSQFVHSCAQLMKYMATKSSIAPKVSAYASSMFELAQLKSEIDRCIRSGRIMDVASKDLAKVRKRIAVIEQRMKDKLDSLMNRHRSIMQENLVSQRGGRYVLPIKKEHRKLVSGSVLDESASGQTVYIEPSEMTHFHYELSGLRAEEIREETKVLTELTALVEEYSQELNINVETAGLYDFIFAKAKYAMSIDGCNVELNEEGIISLLEAKHPLLIRTMVPLQFSIGEVYRSLIITGPNTGGKTMALKTVGLLTVMVQSGLLVPVSEGSMFAIFQHVAIDVGDGQSIEHALSTFSAHIKNIITILQVADRSTLVLIDEMATGTDPGEGVGLSIAILEELHRRQSTVVVTTHYNEIKNFAAISPGFENARMEFDTETLQPLYRLRIGEAGQSYAFFIASKLGVPQDIIARSREITANGLSPSPTLPPLPVPARNMPERSVNSDTAHSRAHQRSGTSMPVRKDQSEQDHIGETNTASVKPFQLGDLVYVAYLGRNGVVYETEDARGNVGVMIQKQKLKINKKRLALHIESKELYPDNYDFDIVFETKENRKKQKLMSRKYVKGLTIERPSEQ